jgi:hypothetical protein
MTRFRPAVLLIALVAAGCERTPLEPASGPDGRLDGGLTLESFFTSAVAVVERTEGSAAAAALMREWHAVRDEAAAADADAWFLRQRKRDLEVRTLLRAYGPAAVDRAVQAVRWEVRTMGGGTGDDDADDVREPLAAAGRLLDEAEALRALAPEAALSRVADAAERVLDARRAVAAAGRLPGLETLWSEAVLALGVNGLPERAASVAEHHARLVAQAADEAARGDRAAAHRSLQEARSVQAAVVAETLGAAELGLLIAELRARSDAVGLRLRNADRAGTDVGRLRRMHAALRGLVVRAAAALDEGDAARAIDLAGHAAGLLHLLALEGAR